MESTERKYWVPALERAHEVLHCLAARPSRLRMMDLVSETGINKSTMFSLLQTMETLHWVTREKGETYALGPVFATLGRAYFSGIDLVAQFQRLAASAAERVGETSQLARLEGTHILYLAKKEAPAPVRLVSEPGMRIPAYATAMGKALLSQMPDDRVRALFANAPFERFTDKTVPNVDALIGQLAPVRERGYAVDEEEVVNGIACIAAAVKGPDGVPVAAVSFTMPLTRWEAKEPEARMEVLRLAQQLSSLQ
ncbi:IclR family transcriptional regulator [Cohnella rhizosphaerae]|uniref:IclR family transcriptional regulator n=1 Tax=Cohnella rhizosphaerae TaxID=1457232 RepID=A0A9X4KPK9_9BACL|nr:IclR family transcriptional regulator [Cohnella rhizosphaerae]MDG0808413.1 IclR family transcriptional regulator [Cohnella rhizosphaerae]